MSNFFFQNIATYVIWKQMTKRVQPICAKNYQNIQKQIQIPARVQATSTVEPQQFFSAAQMTEIFGRISQATKQNRVASTATPSFAFQTNNTQ